jgi:hypothetical protein
MNKERLKAAQLYWQVSGAWNSSKSTAQQMTVEQAFKLLHEAENLAIAECNYALLGNIKDLQDAIVCRQDVPALKKVNTQKILALTSK